jgi:hypothetical protein
VDRRKWRNMMETTEIVQCQRYRELYCLRRDTVLTNRGPRQKDRGTRVPGWRPAPQAGHTAGQAGNTGGGPGARGGRRKAAAPPQAPASGTCVYWTYSYTRLCSDSLRRGPICTSTPPELTASWLSVQVQVAATAYI